MAGVSGAWIDGQPASAEDLRALALTNYGHFTSMQVRGRMVRGLDLHLHRLKSASRELFDATLEDGRVVTAMCAALDAAGADDASLRVTVFSRVFDYGHPDRSVPIDVLVSMSPPRESPGKPAWVRGYPFQRPLPHVKHVGTFPLFQLRRQARREGFDDALLVDPKGRITEGSLWNIGFWDGEQVTWPRGEALRGTAERLLQVGLAEVGLPQRHEVVEARALGGFRAAFAANAGGIWPICGIDETLLKPDPALMERLQCALEATPLRPLGAMR